MKNLFLILAAALCLQACSGGEEQLVVRNYDPYQVTETMELKLSDLVKDIRVVPLESHPDALIPDCQYLVCNEYIVALAKNSIVQFDAVTGKYIRILATSGKGPNEFSMLLGGFIRDNKLIYGQYGKDYLSVIDLKTGAFLPNVEGVPGNLNFPVWVEGAAKELYYMNDTSFLKVYNPVQKTTRYQVDTTIGKMRIAAREEGVAINMQRSYGSKSLVDYHGDKYIYNAAFADTLYWLRKDSGQLIPYSVFARPKTEMGANTALGIPSSNSYDLTIPYVGNRYILCTMTEGAIKATDQSISVLKLSRGVCVIDKKDGSMKRLGKYTFDPLFVAEFEDSPSESFSSDKAIVRHILTSSNSCVSDGLYLKAYPAFQVKGFIEAYLEKEGRQLSDKVRQELLLLDGKLTEESNPVVVIGTIL